VERRRRTVNWMGGGFAQGAHIVREAPRPRN
jgi:hypothetical protein